MKKPIILTGILSFLLSFSALSQSEVKEVEVVIQGLFVGMRAKSTEKIAAAFSSEAILQTIISRPEGNTVRSNSVGDFVKTIGSTPAETQLDEQISNYQISVDGALATAWTPYRFYVNGEFSHCGVNSFQLVKMTDGWKIVYPIDTRRKEPCEE